MMGKEVFYNGKFLPYYYANRYRGLDSDECKEFLIDVRDILDENDIEYFLIFGTLLGAYRDKDFIKYDRDIDIGIFSSDKEKLDELILSGVFLKKGIKSFRDRGYSFCKWDTYMDIYPFKMEGDEYRSLLGWESNFRLLPEYFPTQKIEFLGESFKTIRHIEVYLVDKYGPNWETPVKNSIASC